jgi:cyclin-dependent kinase 12/13
MIYSFLLCVFSQRTEQGGEIPKNVFMVFEYLEYDLTGVLDSPEIRFTQDHVKSWSQQLLSGVHYMHTNKGEYRRCYG